MTPSALRPYAPPEAVTPTQPAPAPSPGRVGVVTHYYPHVSAAIVQIEVGDVRVGDTLHFKGSTTDFRQRVERIEFEHVVVEVALPGQTVGIQVGDRVREHDEVFKLAY